MKKLEQVQSEIVEAVSRWEGRLQIIERQVLDGRRNGQARTIKQILGHLVDSASNNLHRIVHLQYQASPLEFPDYANLGANDQWIAIQRYQEEDWPTLVQLWKFCNLHLAHVIGHVGSGKLDNVWVSALGEQITLLAMIVDYPRHLRLHLKEIEELLAAGGAEACIAEASAMERVDHRQLRFYREKLEYEIDAWDLAELRRNDPSVVVLDTRSQQTYNREHIAGAISFPHRSIGFESTRDLDRTSLYVTYCDGIGCNASTKGAEKLAGLGFNVRELIGGLQWWKRDGYLTEGSEAASGSPSACGCG